MDADIARLKERRQQDKLDKKVEKRIEREEKQAEQKRQEELRISKPSRNSKKHLNYNKRHPEKIKQKRNR